ncbi:MAG TPA: RdgB/HAM1 family non-canonical purine NTP pyrophosphatase [Bauldia sp.]|nr:RdgB/HAM1 family non-canonical purine NTP pyrophosphatase [Bauldia sp.]
MQLRRGDTLVIATHNQGKLKEFRELLEPHGLTAVPAGDLGLAVPEETGVTFEENAEIKAAAAAKAAGLPALADDSGVVVDALGGAPGVYSADWAGPAKDFALALRKVEDGLRDAGANTPALRTARFVAVLCLVMPGHPAEFFKGEVEGTIVWPPRGTNGFGYDPIFVPDGHERTFGEMRRSEKQALSHRARAFARFAEARLPK